MAYDTDSERLPDTMRAVRLHAFGGPEQLRFEQAVPLPAAPGPGEVLVRIAAAGVGYWDGEVRRGEWQDMITYRLPLILGTDVSGTVAAVGAGVDLVPGQEVLGVVDMTLSGSNAEYGLGRAVALTVKPASVDHTTAAAVPIGASTGRELVRAAQLAAGTRVLVLGAGGTVGSWALQYAARTGADIIATASGADRSWARDHGAGEVIDHHATAFEDVVADVDVVIDPVPGPEVALRALSSLKPGGRLLVCAAPLDPLTAAATDGRTVQFVSYVDTTQQFADIADDLDSGAVTARIGTVLPLDAAPRAHRMLDGAPHPPGKIVLDNVRPD